MFISNSTRNFLILILILVIAGIIIYPKYKTTKSNAKRAQCLEMLSVCYSAQFHFKEANDFYSKTFFYNLNGIVDDTSLDKDKNIFPSTNEMMYYDFGLKAENDVGSILNGRSVLNYPNYFKMSGEEVDSNPNYMNNLSHVPGVSAGKFNCTCRGNIDSDVQLDRITINQDEKITIHDNDI